MTYSQWNKKHVSGWLGSSGSEPPVRKSWGLAVARPPATHIRREWIELLFVVVVLFLSRGSTAEGDDDLALQQLAIHRAVEAATDSVVQIRTVGGLEQVDEQLLAAGPTTGLVISADGYILSSAFNFVQQPSSILVSLPSGRQAPAELVATDHSRMLVLLKVEVDAEESLPVPVMAGADDVEVGAWAIALGRTFHADRPNVSVGIISARNRLFGRALQTDAAVSAANYGGPLIDIRGRVLGLIVPMSPQATSEVAGVEWYDSGIGFAVPLAELGERIERMKTGEDQYAGLLGVGLAGGSTYKGAAKIATVRPQSPADKAGIRSGDRIVEIDGQPVATTTELRFQLVPRYAGAELTVTLARGNERLEREVTLSGPLGAFRHAFLGVLPMRTPAPPDSDDESTESEDVEVNEETTNDRGVAVRMVYPGSPAAEAGVAPGDRIVRLNGEAIKSVSDAIAAMNSVAIGEEVKLIVDRDGAEQELTLAAGELPTDVPNDLPPPHGNLADGDVDTEDNETQVGIVELKISDFENKCQLYVPASYTHGVAPGVLVWLEPGGDTDVDALLNTWAPICDAHDSLLVVPSPGESNRWARRDLMFLRRLLVRVLTTYQVDPRRVVVHGREGAGKLAYTVGFAGRRRVRGVSVSAAAPPRGERIPDAQPEFRLAIYSAQAESGALPGLVRSGIRKLVAAGYPVSTATVADEQGRLGDEEREELARWIDTLDRF